MTDISPFEIKPEADYIYQQYRDSIELEKFFKCIDEIIEEFYFGDTLKQMWACRDISDTNSAYMYFYARYYLGLIRPVKIDPNDFSTEIPNANIINEYDTAMQWDFRFIWDDYSENDPEMPMSMFIAMLKIVYDYSEITWTHDLMIRYAAKMCNMNPNDIQMSFENTKVIYWLVNSNQCRSFVEYMKSDEYKLNFPFSDCYEFRLGDHRANTDRIDEWILGYMRPPTWPSIMKPNPN